MSVLAATIISINIWADGGYSAYRTCEGYYVGFRDERHYQMKVWQDEDRVHVIIHSNTAGLTGTNEVGEVYRVLGNLHIIANLRGNEPMEFMLSDRLALFCSNGDSLVLRASARLIITGNSAVLSDLKVETSCR